MNETNPHSSKKPIVVGFCFGAAVWLSLPAMAAIGIGTSRNDLYITLDFLIFATMILPVLSILLAAIPSTRRFGLGLVLACGLGWLILGAICGASALNR
jgi:hypothetical protein